MRKTSLFFIGLSIFLIIISNNLTYAKDYLEFKWETKGPRQNIAVGPLADPTISNKFLYMTFFSWGVEGRYNILSVFDLSTGKLMV